MLDRPRSAAVAAIGVIVLCFVSLFISSRAPYPLVSSVVLLGAAFFLWINQRGTQFGIIIIGRSYLPESPSISKEQASPYSDRFLRAAPSWWNVLYRFLYPIAYLSVGFVLLLFRAVSNDPVLLALSIFSTPTCNRCGQKIVGQRVRRTKCRMAFYVDCVKEENMEVCTQCGGPTELLE